MFTQMIETPADDDPAAAKTKEIVEKIEGAQSTEAVDKIIQENMQHFPALDDLQRKMIDEAVNIKKHLNKGVR